MSWDTFFRAGDNGVLTTRCRGWIQGVAGKLNSKPLLNIVGGLIEDYDYLWDEYYFSTSTM